MSWDIVRIGVKCAYGCDIPKGERAYFGKRRFVLCVSHARGYSFVPPRNMKKKHAHQQAIQANARDPKLRAIGERD